MKSSLLTAILQLLLSALGGIKAGIKDAAHFGASIIAGFLMRLGVKFYNIYTIEHVRDGVVIGTWAIKNLVTNAGLNDLLTNYFKGSAYTAAFYVGLTGTTPTFAGADTMASHSGWTEFTNYTQTNRQTLTLGSVSGQSVDNSASKATFTVNTGGGTVGGAFITTNNTIGGTTGTLYGGASFGADRVLLATDQLLVTTTLTAATV